MARLLARKGGAVSAALILGILTANASGQPKDADDDNPSSRHAGAIGRTIRTRLEVVNERDLCDVTASLAPHPCG